MNNIKAILLDFGFTLFHFENPSMERYYECFRQGLINVIEFLTELNLLNNSSITEEFKNLFNKKRSQSWKKSIRTKNEYPTYEIFKKVFEMMIEKNFIDRREDLNNSFYMELANLFHSVEAEMWIPLEKTEKTLKKLSKDHIKLAVLSNHPHHNFVKNCLEKYNMTQYFDVIITSAQFGKRKPNPEIFYYTLEQIGMLENAHNCIMCGDEHADIIGGYNVGIKPILCERFYKFPFEKEINIPDLIKVNDISELLKYL